MKHLEIIEGLGGIFSGEEKRADVECQILEIFL